MTKLSRRVLPTIGHVFTIRAVSAPGQVVASAGEGGAIRLTRREPDSLPGSPPAPPGCTSYPEPPSCSACSGRPMPLQSPGLKHSLTRTSPRLRRTRTPSCAPRSSGSSTCSWPPAPLVGVGARHGEEPDAEGADYPRSPSSASAYPRLRVVYSASAIDLMCATTRSLARPRLTHTGSRARPSGPLVPVARGVVCV